jgi:hypothetical protein
MSIPQNDKQSAVTSPAWRLFVFHTLRLFEIARVLVRFDHVAKRHRKRESQHHVSGCKTLRSQLGC